MTRRRGKMARGKESGAPSTEALLRLREAVAAEVLATGADAAVVAASLDQAAILAFSIARGGGPAVPPFLAGIVTRLLDLPLRDLPLTALGEWCEAGLPVAGRERRTPRRAHGAWYTPPDLARLLVDESLGRTLRQRRDQVVAADDLAGWTRWRAELRRLTVLDPACGAGAFLLAAFDVLSDALEEAEAAIARLGGPALRPEPVGQLHGVDLDPRALVVCRATLRLAAGLPVGDAGGGPEGVAGPPLRVGDALGPLDAPPWGARAAGPPWPSAFDVVVGNPPFVRHERLTAQKAGLRGFRVYDGAADLFVYFVERAWSLLGPAGRLGLVLPNKWLRAGYAGRLRAWLAGVADVELVVDFGHAPLFAGTDAFPSLLVAARRDPASPAEPAGRAAVLPPDASSSPHGLRASVDTHTFPLALPRGPDPWTLDPPEVAALFARLEARGRPLAAVAGAQPLYGVKTGCNEAFLVDGATRAALVAADPESATVLRPYLRGQDASRWSPGPAREWIVALRSSRDQAWPWSGAPDAEATFAATLPAVYAHLARFERRLRGRVDQGRYWWELRSCSYYSAFERPRVVYPDLCWAPAFGWTRDEVWVDNTMYLLPCDDPWLVAVLNAPVTWAWLWHHAVHGKDEVLRLKSGTIAAVPVPPPEPRHRSLAASLVPRLQAGPDAAAARALADAVHEAFGLTPEERMTLDRHAPPRTPG